MLHICPRVHGQSLAEPPFEEEILAFIRFLRHKLTGEEIRNSNAYKEYYAIATGATQPNPKATVQRTRSSSDTSITPPTIVAGLILTTSQKGKQAAKATKAKSLSALSKVAMTEAQQLKLVTKRSMQHTHISQTSGSGADEGTGSKPWVPGVPSDESEKELSWNSTDDEGDANEGKDGDGDEEDDGDDGEEGDGDNDDEDDDAMTEAQQLKLVTKRSLQQTHISQASGSGADEGTGPIPGVLDVPTDESEKELSCNSTADEGKDGDGDGDDDDDNGDDGEEGDGDDDDEDDDGEEGDDDNDDDQEVEKDDEKDDEEEGGDDEQEYDEDEYYEETRDEEKGDDDDDDDQEVVRHDDKDDEKDDEEEGGDDEQEYDEETRDEEIFDPIPKTLENSNDEGNGEEDLGLNVGREEGHDEEEEEDELYKDVHINQARAPSTIIQNLPNFGSLFGFDNRLRTLEANISEFRQMNQFAGAVSAIPGIVQRYMDQRMNEAKEQVKVQVSKILSRIEQTVNEQLEAKVLTRSSHSSKTSYAVAADLSEMELKKILIEKMKGNKSIQRSDEQRNIYKALVEAYESDKIILDTYEETVTLKRCRNDDADKDEEPSAGPDQGSKRHREGKEPESVSAPSKTATRSAGGSTQGS
nr:hypothetical protein [Tanacetum cinerariifolium]